jgi:hypothetical protein
MCGGNIFPERVPMRRHILWPALVLAYFAIVIPFTSYMKNRPFIEKMGYTPEPGILKLLAADQYPFVAATLVMKAINYYGGLAEATQNKINVPPEYQQMHKTIETAVHLDPYNMDAYYFDQATIVWGAGQVRATNELLEYGMRHRTWDYYLPFFAGFNYAYFLKDYENAARCYKRVGELTGSDLTMNLAGRYLYEAGKTQLAVDYLSLMVKTASNGALRKSLQTRLQAFLGVRKIEKAADEFRSRFKHSPRTIDELRMNGYLTEIPVDPYGGTFYIDEHGKVRSTSKFAFGVVERTK